MKSYLASDIAPGRSRTPLTLATPALVALFAASTLAACAAPTATDATSQSLATRVAAGESLLILPAQSTLSFTASYDSASHPSARVELAATGGSLTVSVDDEDHLILEDFVLDLADVEVTPGHVPLHFTGLRLVLAEPTATPACWSGDLASLRGATPVTLRLEWALRGQNGEPMWLSPQTLAAIDATLHIRERSGQLLAELTLAGSGTLWSWADGLVTFSDAHATLALADTIID